MKRTFRNRLNQGQNSSNNLTKTQDSCNRISSSLMCKNFCRRNILKHHNKQKQNSKCSNINLQLQQNKIFKALQDQKARTMQKLQNQIKNRVHWVFRFHHLKNTNQCTCCHQSKRLTHFIFLYFIYFYDEFEGTRTPSLRVKSSMLCQLSYKPLKKAIE